VARGARWIDLLDPTREELLAEAPVQLHERAVAQLLQGQEERRAARPTIESHNEYALGILLVAGALVVAFAVLVAWTTPVFLYPLL